VRIKQLIVFGSTSSIAKVLLPSLGVEPKNIISFDRLNNYQETNYYIPPENQFRSDWSNFSETEIFVLNILTQQMLDSVLVLNFMGFFGQIQKIEELDIMEALLTNSVNLFPFLLVAKIAKFLPTNSNIISFSGAGVGGDNLDDSSFGYLAAKASMAVITESIDLQLSPHGIRFGLIAPGAFPSKMQEIVAEKGSTKVPDSRVARAKQIMSSEPSIEKLSRAISFLNDNPDLLGGRNWSANFDEMTHQSKNFGKLRRIY
jgi:NAD(P)-dependent dehydrogenase (short-subunit alcohol dehydrogenase family)